MRNQRPTVPGNGRSTRGTDSGRRFWVRVDVRRRRDPGILRIRTVWLTSFHGYGTDGREGGTITLDEGDRRVEVSRDLSSTEVREVTTYKGSRTPMTDPIGS